MLLCYHIVLGYEILDQNRLVCWSIVMKEGKKLLVLRFFGVFPSDCILKVTKDVSVHFFIHSSNSCKLHQQVLGTF